LEGHFAVSFHDRRLSLGPAGLVVERDKIEPDRLVIYARAAASFGEGPDCGSPTSSAHSRYQRLIQDLRRMVAPWPSLPLVDFAVEKAPSARTAARLMTIQRDSASAEAASLTVRATAALMAARDLLNRIHAKIRIRKPELPGGRIAPAHERGLASFAGGIAADYAAAAPPELRRKLGDGSEEGGVTGLVIKPPEPPRWSVTP
jgi:hypothetical protein